jgi:hypothetical protein
MRIESSPVIDLPEDIVTDWQLVDPVNGKKPERIIINLSHGPQRELGKPKIMTAEEYLRLAS